ncbi:MAG: hypothetical protein IT342_03890 [Candidatus Melainabacteria bacterium]|nr:hypothetical protein [Candidatus Melainabacteria bacterium]
MSKELGFLLGVAASAATLLAVRILMYGTAAAPTGSVVFGALVVGFLINMWLMILDKNSERSLIGQICTGAVVGAVLWVVLAWLSVVVSGDLPGVSMFSGDFLVRAFSGALSGVAAALVHRKVK